MDEMPEVAGDGVGDEGFAVFVPVEAPGVRGAVGIGLELLPGRMLAPDAAALRAERAPLAVVDPVPPLATAKVPARVNVPLAVIGPPVNDIPVVPPEALTLVTVPAPATEMYSTSVAPALTANTLPPLPA